MPASLSKNAPLFPTDLTGTKFCNIYIYFFFFLQQHDNLPVLEVLVVSTKTFYLGIP